MLMHAHRKPFASAAACQGCTSCTSQQGKAWCMERGDRACLLSMCCQTGHKLDHTSFFQCMVYITAGRILGGPPASRPQSSAHRGGRWAGHSHSLPAQQGCPRPHWCHPALARGTLLLSIGMSRCEAILIWESHRPRPTPAGIMIGSRHLRCEQKICKLHSRSCITSQTTPSARNLCAVHS